MARVAAALSRRIESIGARRQAERIVEMNRMGWVMVMGMAACLAAGPRGALADPDPHPAPPVLATAPAEPAADPSLSPGAALEPAAAPEPGASEPISDAAPAIPAPTVIEGRLLGSEAEAFQLCEAFMQRMVAGSYDDAFALIRPYFPISEQKFATLRDETKKQHGLAELQFGKALGSVYIDTASVKDVLLRVRFIERYEFEAIHWEFVFYRPERGWLLNRVGFDDDAEALFQ